MKVSGGETRSTLQSALKSKQGNREIPSQLAWLAISTRKVEMATHPKEFPILEC